MSNFNVTLPGSAPGATNVTSLKQANEVAPRQEVSSLEATGGNSLPAQQSEETAHQVPREKLESAVSNLSDYVQTVSRELQFEIDDDINDVIVTVVDRDTGDVIRQIPQDEVVRMAKYLTENGSESAIKGLFVNTDGMV